MADANVTQKSFDKAIKDLTEANEKNNAELRDLISAKNPGPAPSEDFVKSWKGLNGFWRKAGRVAEHGAVALAYATPAFLTVRGLRNRAAERAAADTVSYTMSPAPDGGISITA